MLTTALTLALAATCASPVTATDEGAPARPNIVLILADDLGIGDPRCYNPDSAIPTPHLDRLAAEGLRFTDAHSPSAVCTPTRYGVLTGRYAWRTRLKSWVLDGESSNLIDLERVTLPELLQREGYRTGCVGKWHLGLGPDADGEEPSGPDWNGRLRPGPLDHGFDTFFGIPASLDMTPYVYVLGDRVVQPPDATVDGSSHRRQSGGGFWRGGAAAEDFRHIEVLPRMTARAIEFLQRSHREAPDEPIFLYYAMTAPHTPWLPTEVFGAASGAGHYGDFVAQVDDAIGQVLAELDRLELTNETLVLVTSDNGSHWPTADIERWEHRANLDYRGQKADVWEGGHRVPFLVRWPGRVAAGASSDSLLSLTDLMATLATISGAAMPEGAGEDSVDQSSVLLGLSAMEAPRTDMVQHSADGMFAIRRGPWKLIEGLGSGGFTSPARVTPQDGGAPGQLYHLGEDPTEARDVYSEHPELVRELTALLEQRRATDDSSGR